MFYGKNIRIIHGTMIVFGFIRLALCLSLTVNSYWNGGRKKRAQWPVVTSQIHTLDVFPSTPGLNGSLQVKFVIASWKKLSFWHTLF